MEITDERIAFMLHWSESHAVIKMCGSLYIRELE